MLWLHSTLMLFFLYLVTVGIKRQTQRDHAQESMNWFVGRLSNGSHQTKKRGFKPVPVVVRYEVESIADVLGIRTCKIS